MTKITFEQFLNATSASTNYGDFMLDLHNYMLDNGCGKPTFEEKKTGLLGSYKHKKTKHTIINVLLKQHGLLVRIYGENVIEYYDFFDTLPDEMVQSIANAGVCRRLVHNTCSTKCAGYDVTIDNERYQRCRYGAFEFLVTDTSAPFVKSFVENETGERNKV